jgi:hypothetical protein
MKPLLCTILAAVALLCWVAPDISVPYGRVNRTADLRWDLHPCIVREGPVTPNSDGGVTISGYVADMTRTYDQEKGLEVWPGVKVCDPVSGSFVTFSYSTKGVTVDLQGYYYRSTR